MSELDALRRENARLLEALVHLANCHAGTAEQAGTLKRTSATERARLASISATAARLLSGDSVRDLGIRALPLDWTVDRLNQHAALLTPEATA